MLSNEFINLGSLPDSAGRWWNDSLMRIGLMKEINSLECAGPAALWSD
jgi:hypothetical protein